MLYKVIIEIPSESSCDMDKYIRIFSTEENAERFLANYTDVPMIFKKNKLISVSEDDEYYYYPKASIEKINIDDFTSITYDDIIY